MTGHLALRASARLPVAVPEKIFGLALLLDFFDRGHSLTSLHPPPAVLSSPPASQKSIALGSYFGGVVGRIAGSRL